MDYYGFLLESSDDGFIAQNRIGLGVNDEALGLETGICFFDSRTMTVRNNRVANGTFDGIHLIAPTTRSIRITENSTFSNGDAGIRIFNPGPTISVNDFQDVDSGPNEDQNYPVLNFAATSGNSLQVGGTLNSVPNRRFRVEIFDNATGHPSGYGEGEEFVGGFDLKTDGNGDATFDRVFPHVPLGGPITATATDERGETSEFSLISNPFERPPITDLEVSGTVSRITFTTVSGLTHTVESTPILTIPESWAAATPPISGTGGTVTRKITNTLDNAVNFRIRVDVP
jgi:hypothetical protein